MREWTTLANLCIPDGIQTGPFGAQLHQSDYSSEGTPVIMPVDLVDGGVSEARIARVSDTHVNRLARYRVRTGDLVYARRGDVGRASLISDDENGWLCGTGCLKATPDVNKIDSKYLYYLMSQADVIGWLVNHAKGTTMLNLNTGILASVPLLCESDLAVQRRIAGVLSAYDGLIENNRKQIKLLEEAAQRLYKEWFVDLKFPGHETTPIVDGFPEGWERATLGNIADINANSASRAQLPEKIDYVDLSSVSNGYVKGSVKFNRDSAPGRAKRLARDGSIAWGMVRPAQRSYALVRHPSSETVFSTGFSVIDARNVPFSFLFGELSRDAFVAYLVGLTNGSTYPAVKPEHFLQYPLFVPPNELLVSYDYLVRPMLDSCYVLQQQIAAAREARDRLLPKLMSGELEV